MFAAWNTKKTSCRIYFRIPQDKHLAWYTPGNKQTLMMGCRNKFGMTEEFTSSLP